MDGLHGLSGHYWDQLAGKMRQVAFACRYGMQDASSILGRPMTPIEFGMFVSATEEWLDREFSPKKDGDQPEPNTKDDDDDLTEIPQR